MSILSHITLGTNDTERAARFYDAVLGELGFARLPKPPGKPPAYENGGPPTIYLYPPEDGRPATWGNGTHIAFRADTRAAVRAFHAAAVAQGGRCEGPPRPKTALRPRILCRLCPRPRWQQASGRVLRRPGRGLNDSRLACGAPPV